MHTKFVLKIIPVAIVVVLILCLIGPASAENKTITMAYQGAGGYYIGDIIVFTGQDFLSNTAVVKIAGPGLPQQGVPPYNLTGTPGTGNTVAVDSSGMWTFYWDTSNMQGDTMLQTARYFLTATDNTYPDQIAKTSIMLTRPIFSVNVTPNPAQPGDYVQMTGDTENSISSLDISIIDSSGNKLRSFYAPVSGTGYFYYSFHVDMPPGTYSIVVSNPLKMSQSLNTIFTVLAPATPSPAGTTGISSPAINNTGGNPATTPATPVVTTSLIPTRAPLPPAITIGGVAGAMTLFCLAVKKR
jgi:hypothetical protein